MRINWITVLEVLSALAVFVVFVPYLLLDFRTWPIAFVVAVISYAIVMTVFSVGRHLWRRLVGSN